MSARTKKGKRRASLNAGDLLGGASGLLGQHGRRATLLAELQASPFGFFATGEAGDDLESLARSFVPMSFTKDQVLPASAMYFVQSGAVTVRSREWKVTKGAGEWVYNPNAIAPHEIDAVC